ALEMFLTYELIFKVFKWLTVGLFAYVITGFLAHPDLRQVVAASLVPHLELTNDSIAALVAIFGTTISPYLFFWQASSEVDEMRAAGKRTEAARRGVRMSELKARSEEHTSELQSLAYLVCRLLLEKKKGTVRTALRCSADLSAIARIRLG